MFWFNIYIFINLLVGGQIFINNYHAGYFMHFISAKFDYNNFQHFTLDAVSVLIR